MVALKKENRERKNIKCIQAAVHSCVYLAVQMITITQSLACRAACLFPSRTERFSPPFQKDQRYCTSQNTFVFHVHKGLTVSLTASDKRHVLIVCVSDLAEHSCYFLFGESHVKAIRAGGRNECVWPEDTKWEQSGRGARLRSNLPVCLLLYLCLFLVKYKRMLGVTAKTPSSQPTEKIKQEY